MKIPALIGLCLLAAPVAAQQMGSVNRNAPTVTNAIEYANDESITLSYKAITWAEGRTMEAAMDKEGGARTRQFINGQAEQNPLGNIHTTVDLHIGKTKIAAGEYQVFFTISDDVKWTINFSDGDNKVSMPLDLQKSEMKHSRLLISLHAGEKPTDAGLYIAFGSSHAMYDVKAGKGEGGEK